MLRPSPNHGTQRLPNDDDSDKYEVVYFSCVTFLNFEEEICELIFS